MATMTELIFSPLLQRRLRHVETLRVILLTPASEHCGAEPEPNWCAGDMEIETKMRSPSDILTNYFHAISNVVKFNVNHLEDDAPNLIRAAGATTTTVMKEKKTASGLLLT
jgi:hypothetical protein